MVDSELDSALFDIEQDLMDLEEELVKSGGPSTLSEKVLAIAEKAKELQNG